MSEAVELATAYINLVPTFSGVQGAIAKGIGVPAEKAGVDAGKRAGKGMGSSLASGLKSAMGPVAAVLGAAAVGGLLRESFAEAREAQKVGATTEQIIRSTGGAAKVTAADVGVLTSAISAKAGVDDEAIQKGANLLLTFKNVRNEAGQGANVFDRATQSAVDLSAAGFGSVEGASKMLGKALQDPVKGTAALGRAGVQFTDQQKEQIKTLVASGKTLEAQKIILGEVESQVGGVAAASATMGEKAGVAFSNLKESIGTRLAPVADALFALVLEKGIPAIESLVGFMADDLVPAVGQAAVGVQSFGQFLSDNRGTIAVVAGVITALLLPAIIGAGVQATISAGKQAAGWLLTQGAAVRSSAVQFASYYRIIGAGTVAGARAVASGAVIVGQWIAMQAAALASSAITVASNIRAAGSFVLQRAAMLGGVIAMTAVRVATIAYTAVQWLLNAALSANPIGLVVIAVGLLIAGIVLLWKNSETFRRIVLAVWAAVKGAVLFAIKTLVNAAVGLAAWFVKTWKAGVELKDRLIAAFIAANVRIVATVLSLRDKVVGFFTGLRDTMVARVLNLRNRVAAYFTELRDTTIRGVLILRDKVIGFFTGLRDTAVARTLSLRDRVVGYVTGLRDTAIARVLNLRDRVIGFFTGMRDSTVARATELRDRIISRIVGLAADMTKKANLVKNNALAPFRLLRDEAGTIFRKVRDAAGAAFDQLRDKVKEPIRFVIETIINKGLIDGFNNLASSIGLKGLKVDHIPLPRGFYGGGSTGNLPRNAVAGEVHGNEHVWTAAEVVKAGGHRVLEGMRAAVRAGQSIPGYLAGGQVAPVPGQGRRHTSGYPWASYAGDFPNPTGTPVRSWKDGVVALVRSLTTSYGKHIRINHPDNTSSLYAHMSRLLATVGQNVRAGQTIGAVGSTGNSTGPHLHFETKGGAFNGGSAAPGGGPVGDFLAMLRDKFSGPLSKLGDLGQSPFAKIAGALVTRISAGLTDKFGSAASAIKDAAVGVATGVANAGVTGAIGVRYGPLIAKHLLKNGMSLGLVDNFVRQIKSESGGNPRAVQGNIGDVNNRSGDLAKGLLQVIGATFDTYRDPSLPNDRFNAEASIAASIRYVKSRYSNPEAVIGYGHGYANGTLSAASGRAAVAERGAEVVMGRQVKNMRGGERVASAGETRGLLGGVTINGGVHGHTAAEVGAAIETERRHSEALHPIWA